MDEPAFKETAEKFLKLSEKIEKSRASGEITGEHYLSLQKQMKEELNKLRQDHLVRIDQRISEVEIKTDTTSRDALLKLQELRKRMETSSDQEYTSYLAKKYFGVPIMFDKSAPKPSQNWSSDASAEPNPLFKSAKMVAIGSIGLSMVFGFLSHTKGNIIANPVGTIILIAAIFAAAHGATILLKFRKASRNSSLTYALLAGGALTIVNGAIGILMENALFSSMSGVASMDSMMTAILSSLSIVFMYLAAMFVLDLAICVYLLKKIYGESLPKTIGALIISAILVVILDLVLSVIVGLILTPIILMLGLASPSTGVSLHGISGANGLGAANADNMHTYSMAPNGSLVETGAQNGKNTEVNNDHYYYIIRADGSDSFNGKDGLEKNDCDGVPKQVQPICWEQVAQKFKDPAACEKIDSKQTQFWKDVCFTEMAKALKDKSYCDKLASLPKESCIKDAT